MWSGRSPRYPLCDEIPHAPRHVRELIVVSRRQLEPLLIGDSHQRLGLFRADGEGLLHVDVRSPLQALPRDREMAFGRRRDVHHVGTRNAQKLVQLAEMPFDRKPLEELLRHERLTIAHADDLAPLDPPDLRGVRVGDLPAPDDSYLKHFD